MADVVHVDDGDRINASEEQIPEDEDGYLPLDDPKEANDVVNDAEASPVAVRPDESEWNRTLPPPWLDEGTSRNNSISRNMHPMTFLHNEIVSFVQLMEPLPSEIEQRELLVRRIQKTVQDNFPDGTRVEVFGSQATGLFLPTSDIDLVVMSPTLEQHDTPTRDVKVPASPGDATTTKNQRKRHKRANQDDEMKDDQHADGDDDDDDDYEFATQTSLHCFAQALRKEWGVSELSYLEVIEHTRIPLVKFTHATTNISVDVSFDQPTGPPAALLMKRYLEALPPLRPLTFVLKYFLAARGLNEPYTGGVGSFLLQLMIVAFLQHRERDAVNFKRLGVYNLGALLLEFLQLYGIEFNYFSTGISVRYDGFFFPKGAADRRSTFWKADRTSMVSKCSFHQRDVLYATSNFMRQLFQMAMENPLEPTLDVGQSSFRYQTVQRSFAVAYKMLLAYITARPIDTELLNVASVLATILPPTNYMTSRKVQKRSDQPESAKRQSSSISLSKKRHKI